MSDKLSLKQPVIDRIVQQRVFAVIRLKDTSRIEDVAGAILENGMNVIEITLNSDNALEAIHRVSQNFSSCLLGAGTVLGYEHAVQAIERGARFLVSPVIDLDMLAIGNEIGVTTMAGALTPTEAWQAYGAGSDFVKLFPLAGLGPQYIRAMRGPLDMIRYVPTNGVTVENVQEWLDAGASAVGIGSALVSDADVASGDISAIGDRVKRIMDSLK
jgi:2-dehydro-3-deoxyphosphogluconate aldolase/(4S)-4-hydroxy-2-oxoglutarate aldolase